MSLTAEAVRADTAYFRKLCGVAGELIGGLELTADPQPIATIAGELNDRVESARTEGVTRIAAAAPFAPQIRPASDGAAGLNTVGMLTDRLTILLIKLWYMRNIYDDPAGADTLQKTHIDELVAALAEVRPGASSMNTKVTVHEIKGEASNWAEAFYGLLMTNLLLWESQEVLYRADITTLPEAELRGYLSFFSQGNLQRNQFIELCERHFWQGVTPKPSV